MAYFLGWAQSCPGKATLMSPFARGLCASPAWGWGVEGPSKAWLAAGGGSRVASLLSPTCSPTLPLCPPVPFISLCFLLFLCFSIRHGARPWGLEGTLMHETQLDPQEARGGPRHEPEIMAQELRASVDTSSSELLLGSFLEGSQSFELQLSQPTPSRTQGPRADKLVPAAAAPGGLLPTPPALVGSVVHGGGTSLGVRVWEQAPGGACLGAQLCHILFSSPELQLKPASFYQEKQLSERTQPSGRSGGWNRVPRVWACGRIRVLGLPLQLQGSQAGGLRAVWPIESF